MDPCQTRELGRTALRVTQLGLGGASIGSMFLKVPEEGALATVRRAWDEGIRLFDTAPWYGRGRPSCGWEPASGGGRETNSCSRRRSAVG